MSILIHLAFLAVQASNPQAPQSVLGEVSAVQAQGLTLRTDAGALLALVTDKNTSVLRSRPGARDLSDAAPVSLTQIAQGDRVLARGVYSPDRTTFRAVRLVVMKQADIEVRREQERAEWRRRGLAGVITALDGASREISVRLRGASNGQQTLVVRTRGREVVFRRYAPDSVRFSDARPSSFEELEVGDQVRMLGERSEDGGGFGPEQVVSGAFRTLRGAVLGVSAAMGELTVRASSNGGEPATVTVAVGPDVPLHRLPADSSRRPPVAGQASGPPPGSNLDEVLDRAPRITLAEVQAGEEIAVLGTRSEDPSRLRAMKLVAGLPASAARGGESPGRSGPGGGEEGEGSDTLGLGGELPW